ncbi:hypothetical protein ABW19_dt0200045 [Dactylella cylindrospora]|nr:hypothetical protein ABW19_dt0200045 [Dactylella cylindrospora]
MRSLPFLIDRRRDALAAPATEWGDRVLNQVIFVVSLASMLGAGWVIASYAFIKELRSYRHQLILGLAISDFLMALNFMVSSGIDVGGGDLGSADSKAACDATGFLTQVFVVQTDYWILIIAIATYIILGNFKGASHFIQTNAWLPWVPPWIISVVMAIVCQEILGYGYIGAWCWLTSDIMRLVVNFIPRWIIVIAIALIYTRLYMIVRKARKWDIEARAPSDEMADTSVILVSVTRKSTIGRTAPSPASASGELSEHSQSHHQSQSRSLGQTQPLNADQLKRIAKKMMVYPLAYAIIWSCPTAIRIYQSTTGSRAPLWITIVDKSCIVIQGFVDAIVYGESPYLC